MFSPSSSLGGARKHLVGWCVDCRAWHWHLESPGLRFPLCRDRRLWPDGALNFLQYELVDLGPACARLRLDMRRNGHRPEGPAPEDLVFFGDLEPGPVQPEPRREVPAVQGPPQPRTLGTPVVDVPKFRPPPALPSNVLLFPRDRAASRPKGREPDDGPPRPPRAA